MPGPPPKSVTLTSGHDKWRDIICQLVVLGVGEWKAGYHDPCIMDGSGWSLVVRSTELNRKSAGMNAHPPNFDAVREVIERAAQQNQP